MMPSYTPLYTRAHERLQELLAEAEHQHLVDLALGPRPSLATRLAAAWQWSARLVQARVRPVSRRLQLRRAV